MIKKYNNVFFFFQERLLFSFLPVSFPTQIKYKIRRKKTRITQVSPEVMSDQVIFSPGGKI